MIYQRLDDWEGAIKSLDKVLELNPKDSSGYVLRGVAKMQAGFDDKNYCKNIKKGLSMGYKHASRIESSSIKEKCKLP